MTTLDMTQVVGLQAVDAEGNVIGTLSVNDLTELVAKNLVESTQNQVVAARSVSTLSEASTLAASDDYENTLPIDANPASVRTLDADGNPKQTAISSLAQVVGELLNAFQINRTYWGNTAGKQTREFLYMKGAQIREFIISVARVEGSFWGCFWVFCGSSAGGSSMQVKTISNKDNSVHFFYKDGHYYIDVNQTYVVCSIVETNYYPFYDKISIQQIETVLPEDATEATIIGG